MGIKAGLDMLSSEFIGRGMKVYFAHNFNQNYLTSMIKSLGKSSFGIIVISKSGTTLEPAIAFSLFYKKLIKNVGYETANKLVVTVTDKEKGSFAITGKYKG
ncbi:MAG: hypothetical protein MJ200_00605 [Mycoplasmoidaceae bacterium]|nr:hypothetical protein [Mycoplasmoidaceae bacterium]